ncbi:MAG: hypothetical protein ABIK90_04625 [candidate division WOR-3 bacterium]
MFSDKIIYYQILGISFNFYNNTFSGKDYNYYNGKYLNEKDKEAILQAIPSEGWKLSSEGSLSFLSLSYRFWNLSVSLNTRGRGRIKKEIFELLFFGNRLNQIYQTEENRGEVFVFSQIKNTFCFSLKNKWKIGFGINYLKGYYYLKAEDNYLYLLTTQKFLNLYNEINYKKSFGGNGFGFDIGIGKEIDEKFGVKIIMENINNKIFWQKENHIGKIVLIVDSLNFDKISKGNYYFFNKEEKETIQFVNRPLPFEINLSCENVIKDFLKINSGISWAEKEYVKLLSRLDYQPFNFLGIINFLNLYLLTDKDASLGSPSYEIGIGFRVIIKDIDFFFSHEYYKGFLLGAKGFSFKFRLDYNFSY